MYGLCVPLAAWRGVGLRVYMLFQSRHCKGTVCRDVMGFFGFRYPETTVVAHVSLSEDSFLLLREQEPLIL